MPRRSTTAVASTQTADIVAALRRILAQLTGESSGLWMDLEVTMPQMKVLMLLRENGSMRVGVLARHLNVSTPTITGIVDRLVRQGIVARLDDPSDRRVVLNQLTPKGTELMERLAHRSDAELNRLVAALSAAEQEEIAGSLTRLDQVLTPVVREGAAPSAG